MREVHDIAVANGSRPCEDVPPMAYLQVSHNPLHSLYRRKECTVLIEFDLNTALNLLKIYGSIPPHVKISIYTNITNF